MVSNGLSLIIYSLLVHRIISLSYRAPQETGASEIPTTLQMGSEGHKEIAQSHKADQLLNKGSNP